LVLLESFSAFLALRAAVVRLGRGVSAGGEIGEYPKLFRHSGEGEPHKELPSTSGEEDGEEN
jgi:hypothetical protein